VAGEGVLIVDDNAANRKLLHMLLDQEAYDVREAADAGEAVRTLKAFHPRLILMDVQLPGVDGLELTRRLKADPATQPIVIIAVTAQVADGDAERVLQAGCDDYVAKPIDIHAVLALVARHLRP
jgi:two-component system, cell cycle response regulator DivK